MSPHRLRNLASGSSSMRDTASRIRTSRLSAEYEDQSGRPAPRELLDVLLSNLASGQLAGAASNWNAEMRVKLLAETSSRMRERSTVESEKKAKQAGSLLESRRANAINLHDRKRRSIGSQIKTLEERGITNMIPAAKGRLKQVDLNHEALVRHLEIHTTPGLAYEDFAVCEIEVVNG